MCGTAPSLVEAMYLGLPVICFKVPTNMETTERKAIYFETVPDLVGILNNITDADIKLLKRDLQDIAVRRYNWKRITQIYKDCIDKCIGVKNND